MSAESDPLIESPPEEVPLPRAPLVRVIAQVRFSSILAVQDPEYIAPFQEAIRRRYPVLRKEHAQSILLSPDGAIPGERQVAWRFSDADTAWRVSLAPEFIALETTAYTSRGDFLERMQAILESASEHVQPEFVERLGLRYIDRVVDSELSAVVDLVRPEMLGIVKTPLFSRALHEISEAMLSIPNARDAIRMRWGHLPPNTSIDPNAIEPIKDKSWLLDFDMFSEEQRPFNPGMLSEDLRRFAERIYTMFRWAVTDEFLRRYGGAP